MREAARRKMKQMIVILLVLTLLIPSVFVYAGDSRYNQSGSFEATGSPLLNPNFSTDAWNKWETVAWGVFLSNFVVPMADTYESAFNTSANYGSKGSGYKALDFSQSGDPASRGILTNFLQFAIELAMKGDYKDIYVSYYYMDEKGKLLAEDGSELESSKNPVLSTGVQPVNPPAGSFRDLLLANLQTTNGSASLVVNNEGGWLSGLNYGDGYWWGILSAFGGKKSVFDYNSKSWNNVTIALPKARVDKGTGASEKAFAKFPVLWVKRADESGYVKVWDMLDPWDYQMTITMLAKEINSDAEIDSGLGTEAICDIVFNNINKAFKNGVLKMDAFGNIICLVDGLPLMAIPAAYNKHITTEPLVNLVNSLFLTGATSGISSKELIDTGKQASNTWYSKFTNTVESSKDDYSEFGVGIAALGWAGKKLPENAVLLYYDSDSLIGNMYTNSITSETVTYDNNSNWELPSIVAADFGVLDLDLYGNRQFKVNGITNYIVPKFELSGISKVGGLGKKTTADYKDLGEGVVSLMTMLTTGPMTVNLLPASTTEGSTTYAQKMMWRESENDLFGNPVVIPTAFITGTTDSKKIAWSHFARDFVSYYGTTYYPRNRASELQRFSTLTSTLYHEITRKLLHDGDKASPAVVAHAGQANVSPYLNLSKVASADVKGFIWASDKVIKTDLVANSTSWFGVNGSTEYTHLTQRWIKAYTVNASLKSVATYLGMRGDTEFAAAAAPWVYLTYLKIYGVTQVKSLTLNENPTKFNDQIYNSKGGSLFDLNPTSGTALKSDEEMARDVSVLTWKLLSPTEGNEYKRQLISTIIGNFVYDQYNRTVFGGSLEYNSGGVQQVVTRSQTGFLRFPSLEDNMFTRWFYSEYATVALWLLAVGLVFIIVFGIFRRRKITWFIISVVLLVASVVVIPFTNDMAASSMDSLVSNIMKDKTTLWSMTEMITNARAERDYLSSGMSGDEAELATSIMRDLSIVYSDRSLVLKQDISRKITSLGNFSELQSFASTRWMLPSVLRQFTAEDGSNNYLYIPMLDVLDDAANAYWWYNPQDALVSGGIAGGDLEAKYAVGTQKGQVNAAYEVNAIKKFYPEYHSSNVSDTVAKSYRSITQAGTQAGTLVPTHDYIYMLMHNTYEIADIPYPLIPASSSIRAVSTDLLKATNKYYWGDPDALEDATKLGGSGSYLALAYKNIINSSNKVTNPTLNAEGRSSTSYDRETANLELIQLVQKYVRDERDTMSAEFGYIWSSETVLPYFYALVKDTMSTMGLFDYETGAVDGAENKWEVAKSRMGVLINALTGRPQVDDFYGKTRSNFMYQSGLNVADLAKTHSPAKAGTTGMVFTGYGRDVLDLESVFYNMIPYMYEMTILTGGLTGGHENDKGIYGKKLYTEIDYATYKGLPQSFLYRCNWAVKIVEAPAYNKQEKIGYWDNGTKKYATVQMTYYPAAYLAATDNKRGMIFSEAQMYMEGLSENDLTTLELKLIRLNKEISDKWTMLLNYVGTDGMTAEVMCRQMALDAALAFNAALTPSGLGNSAYSLYPSTVDLRSLSFDTIMRAILLNSTKDTNYFNTDAMETIVLDANIFTGILLLVTTWVCVYGVTLVRAFFLAFLFLMGVYGIARSVLSANNSKKATLFGYLVNILLLFVMSFIYYYMFNLLMTGANDRVYVSSGMTGVAVSPGWSIAVVLVGSILYIFGMYKMFRIAFGAVLSGTGDLGLGKYKDVAMAGINKVSAGIKDIRSAHSFEDMSQTSASGGGLFTKNTSTQTQGTENPSIGSKKRKGSMESGIAANSGARALQSNGSTTKVRKDSAMDDYESVDSVISRGGNQDTSK